VSEVYVPTPGREPQDRAVAWIVATEDTVKRWQPRVARAGWVPHPLPWGRARPGLDARDVAALGAWRPDLVLLTSAHAANPSLEALPWLRGLDAACVGRVTEGAASAIGLRPVVVGEGAGEDLAREILARAEPWPRVLFLRGAEALGAATAELRRAGRDVREVRTYSIEPLAGFEAEVAEAPEPGTILAGSPRAADVLRVAMAKAGRSVPAGCRVEWIDGGFVIGRPGGGAAPAG
jgi:uroporphyrinogen-III synthase